MPRHALVLSASVGAGHMRAADAVAGALRRRLPRMQVELIDVLEDAAGWFRGLYGGGYLLAIERLPALVGWGYARTDRPGAPARTRLALERAGLRRLVDRLERTAPELIVCTHFLPAEIASWMRRTGRLASHLSVVVTDTHPHAVWIHEGTDRWFLAGEESDALLERLGIAAEARVVTGIPIDGRFGEPLERLEARRRQSLPTEGRIVLATGGGLGLGPIGSMVEELVGLEEPPLLVVVCGRNDELRRRLEAHRARAKGRLRVLGFTNDMDELMAASDLLVGKPGGLTTAEAMARALPMALVPGVPGQEDRNAEQLVELGAAIVCRTPSTLGWKIRRLLADPQRLRRMRIASGAAGRPHAADAIAASLATIGAVADAEGAPTAAPETVSPAT